MCPLGHPRSGTHLDDPLLARIRSLDNVKRINKRSVSHRTHSEAYMAFATLQYGCHNLRGTFAKATEHIAGDSKHPPFIVHNPVVDMASSSSSDRPVATEISRVLAPDFFVGVDDRRPMRPSLVPMLLCRSCHARKFFVGCQREPLS